MSHINLVFLKKCDIYVVYIYIYTYNGIICTKKEITLYTICNDMYGTKGYNNDSISQKYIIKSHMSNLITKEGCNKKFKKLNNTGIFFWNYIFYMCC